MFINIKIDLAVMICTISIPVFVVLYFLIFKKYNKRNNVSWQEIIFDAIEFITNSVIHLLILILGIDYMIEGLLLLDAIYERYANFAVGVLVISGVIYHYISYIKKLLKDVDQDFAKKEQEVNYKIGEYIIFIFLCVLLINPIINLPKFASLVGDKTKMIKEIFISLGYTVASLFLLYHINPLRIIDKGDKEKIEKVKSKEKNIKEEKGVVSELKHEVNEKVDIEDTEFKDVNEVQEKIEDVFNDATLNMPDTKKIIIPDETELNDVKNKKDSKNKNTSKKKKSNKTNSKNKPNKSNGKK